MMGPFRVHLENKTIYFRATTINRTFILTQNIKPKSPDFHHMLHFITRLPPQSSNILTLTSQEGSQMPWVDPKENLKILYSKLQIHKEVDILTAQLGKKNT